MRLCGPPRLVARMKVARAPQACATGAYSRHEASTSDFRARSNIIVVSRDERSSCHVAVTADVLRG